MENELTFRWLDPTTKDAEQDWGRVERIMRSHKWMSLNRISSRVLLAEDPTGLIVGLIVFQLVPFVGPFHIHSALRGTGLAEEMARQMWEFLISAKARGWIASAESQHAEKLCEAFGMERIEHPMYVVVGMEERKT